MEINKTKIPGVLLLEPKVHGDARGFFFEVWKKDRYESAGVTWDMLQDNVSFSAKGVLRGLHFQHPRAQGKMVTTLEGAIYDVVVDIRKGSPTYGQWLGFDLSSENRHQLWVPPGLAHGFCVTSPTALVSYKCSQYYFPEDEVSLLWNDPTLSIPWPIEAGQEPSLSAKDRVGIPLKELPSERLLAYK